jgi:hypothetical protein
MNVASECFRRIWNRLRREITVVAKFLLHRDPAQRPLPFC